MTGSLTLLIGVAVGLAIGAVVTRMRRKKMVRALPREFDAVRDLTARVVRLSTKAGVTPENRARVSRALAHARRESLERSIGGGGL